MSMPVVVLVTSAGAASAVNVIRALRSQREPAVTVVAVDSDPTAAGLFLADHREIVGRCDAPEYIPQLLQICRRYRVAALFPIFSREIRIVSGQAARFAEQGVATLLPPPEAIDRCDDKAAMARLMAELGVTVPQQWSEREPIPFPLFAKPNVGSGSKGAMRVDTPAALAYVRAAFPGHLIQEFIAGAEYTVDILADRDSTPLAVSPRRRIEVKAGQTVKGETVANGELEGLCGRICRAVGMIGPCNIQWIERGGEWVFLEMNPRYAAGGLMLTVRAGANLPAMALRRMLGMPVEPARARSGATMIRYWEEIVIGGE